MNQRKAPRVLFPPPSFLSPRPELFAPRSAGLQRHLVKPWHLNPKHRQFFQFFSGVRSRRWKRAQRRLFHAAGFKSLQCREGERSKLLAPARSLNVPSGITTRELSKGLDPALEKREPASFRLQLLRLGRAGGKAPGTQESSSSFFPAASLASSAASGGRAREHSGAKS